MRSKYNRYYKELMEDDTILWLKQNDPHYSDERHDKGLEYPYLTKKKEIFRLQKEIPLSNLYEGQVNKCRDFFELDNNPD